MTTAEMVSTRFARKAHMVTDNATWQSRPNIITLGGNCDGNSQRILGEAWDIRKYLICREILLNMKQSGRAIDMVDALDVEA